MTEHTLLPVIAKSQDMGIYLPVFFHIHFLIVERTQKTMF